MIKRVFETNNELRKKYNKLLVEYETLANNKINELEKDREILLQNIKYRDEIACLKEEIKKYKRKFGKLKGGDQK